MKTIKVMFDYKCFPLWIYDENGIFIDNKLPEDLPNYNTIQDSFTKLQKEYEKLFKNNKTEFSYIGFQSEEQKTDFAGLFNSAVDLLNKSAIGKYNLVNTVDVNDP